MKHLRELYPEKRVERKREELDRLATTYVEKLFGFLPCLDLTNKEANSTAEMILELAANIFEVQRQLGGDVTAPLQGAANEMSSEVLTNQEHAEMVALIKQFGIVVYRDDHDGQMYILHDSIQGRATALNEREVYEIVQDIANRLSVA